jgi:DNA-binding transcriptional MerR regulator
MVRTMENVEAVTIWLTATEAAEHIGLKAETLHQYRRKGLGPPYYINPDGRSVRYLREDLDEYMRRGRVVPAGANG